MLLTEVVDEIKTHFMFSNVLFKSHAVYEIMGENILELDLPHVTVWCMHIACWITNATNIHSEYVIPNAFHGSNGFMKKCYVYTYTASFVPNVCHCGSIVLKVGSMHDPEECAVAILKLNLIKLRFACNMFNWCYQWENFSQTIHVTNGVYQLSPLSIMDWYSDFFVAVVFT